MEIKAENLVIVIVLLLPGFISTSIRQSRTGNNPNKLSAFQETFNSLANSFFIALIHFGIILIVLRVFPNINLELGKLFTEGPTDYVQANLTNSIITILLIGTSLLFFSILFGYIDPLYRLANWNHERLGVPGDIDLWYRLFAEYGRENNQNGYTIVWLKSGTCYAGWMQWFEALDEMTEPRLFCLRNARKWLDHASVGNNALSRQMEFAMLKYDEDVVGIDVIWVDR